MAASTQRSPTTRLKVKLFPGSLHMSPETYLPGHSLPIKTAFASSPVEIPERRGDSSHSSNSHQSPLCQRGLLSSECNADDHPLEATTKHISAGSSPQHWSDHSHSSQQSSRRHSRRPRRQAAAKIGHYTGSVRSCGSLRTCEEVSDSDADSRAGSDADSALESEADPSSSDDEAPRPRRTRSRTLLRRSLLSTDSLPNLSSRKRSHALASTSDLQGLDQIEGSTPTERAASARSFADAAWARAREKVAEANRLMAIAQQKAAREQSLVHKKRRCAQQRRGPRDGISYPAHILDGARVSVYWPDDKAFYKGQLLAVDESSNSHLIRYDDDVEEWLCLADERFQWLGPRGRSAGFDMRVKDEMHALGALEVESCASADAEPALTLEEALATPAAAEGAAAVGWRVAVLFVGDGKRYSGEVLAYNAKDKRHLVLYDDGEDEMLNLSMEAVHWLSARNGKSVAAGLPPGEVAPQGEAGIGWRIRVYWPADMQLYRGEVVGYEAETRLHFVQYADGEEEWLQLDREKLCWEQPPPSSDAQDDEDFRPSADSLAGSKAGRKAATGRAGSRAAVAERAAAGRASRAARADAQAGTHSGEAGRPVRVTRNKLIPKKGSASASVLATSLPAKLGDGANSWVSQLLEEPMARRETFGNSLTRSLSHSMGHTLGTPDSPVLNSPILGASGPGFGLRPRLSSGFAPLELAPLEDTMPSGDCSVLSQQQQAQQPQRSDSPAVVNALSDGPMAELYPHLAQAMRNSMQGASSPNGFFSMLPRGSSALDSPHNSPLASLSSQDNPHSKAGAAHIKRSYSTGAHPPMLAGNAASADHIGYLSFGQAEKLLASSLPSEFARTGSLDVFAAPHRMLHPSHSFSHPVGSQGPPCDNLTMQLSPTSVNCYPSITKSFDELFPATPPRASGAMMPPSTHTPLPSMGSVGSGYGDGSFLRSAMHASHAMRASCPELRELDLGTPQYSSFSQASNGLSSAQHSMDMARPVLLRAQHSMDMAHALNSMATDDSATACASPAASHFASRPPSALQRRGSFPSSYPNLSSSAFSAPDRRTVHFGDGQLSSSYQEGRLSGPNPFDSYLAVSGATRSQAADPNGGVPVTDASMLESLFLDEKQLSDSLDELLDPLSLDQPERCHQPMASSLEAGNPGLDRILGQVGLDNRAFDSCMADEFMWGDDLLRSDTPATRSA